MIHETHITRKIPFCALAYWSAEHGEWLRWTDGLTVRHELADELIIHFWMPYPLAEAGAQPAHVHRFAEDEP